MSTNTIETTLEIDQARSMAEHHGHPFVDLSKYQVDVALWSQIPMDLVLRYRFVPLREEGLTLVVAVSRPDNYRDLDDLELALGRPLALEVAPAEQIDSIIERNAAM